MPGVGGFYQVLCCDFFLAISTPGAGAGGLYIETGGAQTRTRTKRRTVVSSRVTWRGGSRWLFGDVPTRASAAVHTVYFQLGQLSWASSLRNKRPGLSGTFVRRSSRVRAPGGVGGVCSGGAWRRINWRARLLTRRRSITGAVRPVAHTESAAAPPIGG